MARATAQGREVMVMSATAWIVLVIVVLVILSIGIVEWARSRAHQRQLQDTFGKEYDVAVAEQGSRSRAQEELDRRQQRHDELSIRPLSAASRRQYLDEWDSVQARFVDRPQNAVAEADELIAAVMADRGYPTQSFEQRAADLSVEHSRVLESFRKAHELSSRAPSESSTEELRQAMVEYRRLFTDLVSGTVDVTDRDVRTTSDAADADHGASTMSGRHSLRHDEPA